MMTSSELSSLFAGLTQALTGDQMTGLPAIYNGIGRGASNNMDGEFTQADTSLGNTAR